MNTLTLLQYLIGNDVAVRAIATNRWALAIGLLFVLSAGLARCYRRVDLSRGPWRIFVPLIASLLLALLLELLLQLVIATRTRLEWSFTDGYLSLVALFWMTAPLAWLYGLPFERMVAPPRALTFRAATLASVALLRVSLIARAVGVLYGFSIVESVAIVMLFGDAIALVAAVSTMPRRTKRAPRILGAMGAFALNSRRGHEDLRRIAQRVVLWGALTLPLWALGTWYAAAYARPTVPRYGASASTLPSRDLWACAVGSLLFWCLFLPRHQRKQRLATRADERFNAGNVAECVREMSAHRQQDYPDLWTCPPHGVFAMEPVLPSILDAVDCVTTEPCASWVRDQYVRQFGEFLKEPHWWWFDVDAMARVVGLLHRLPEGRQLAAAAGDEIDDLECTADRSTEYERLIRNRHAAQPDRATEQKRSVHWIFADLQRIPSDSDTWRRARQELWNLVGRTPEPTSWDQPDEPCVENPDAP